MEKKYSDVLNFIKVSQQYLVDTDADLIYNLNKLLENKESLSKDEINQAINKSKESSRNFQRRPDRTKLDYCLKKMIKNFTEFLKSYNNDLEEINILLCATDKDGCILRDEKSDSNGDLKFTPKNMIERNKRTRELFDKIYTFEPFYCKKEDLPKDLDDSFVMYFEDFVIEKLAE